MALRELLNNLKRAFEMALQDVLGYASGLPPKKKKNLWESDQRLSQTTIIRNKKTKHEQMSFARGYLLM